MEHSWEQIASQYISAYVYVIYCPALASYICSDHTLPASQTLTRIDTEKNS